MAGQNAQDLKEQGNAAMRGSDVLTAERCYRTALEVDPGYMPAAYNLGNLLRATARFDEALEAYRLAADLVPDDYEIHNNLGVTLMDLMRPQEALEAFDRARTLAPQAVEPRVGRATTLSRIGRVEEGIALLDDVLEAYPDFAQARYFRGMDHLLLGRFEQGFVDHEARLEMPDYLPDLRADAVQWDGTPLHGKTLLIYPEQGVGDVIQFLRYAPLCKEAGARVMVVCQPSLVPALRMAAGIDLIVSDGSSLPESYDAYISVMSLGRLFGSGHGLAPTCLSGSGAELPASRSGSGPRVGICWTGNSAQARNRERSVPVEQLIAAFPEELSLYSLQLPSPQILDDRVFDLGRLIGDYADTVSFIQQLDLVVSVCTSPVHVAASLGVPTWVLLSYSPDWRWGLHGNTTPLYPSVRLFRQASYGDWDSALSRVREALRLIVP